MITINIGENTTTMKAIAIEEVNMINTFGLVNVEFVKSHCTNWEVIKLFRLSMLLSIRLFSLLSTYLCIIVKEY